MSLRTGYFQLRGIFSTRGIVVRQGGNAGSSGPLMLIGMSPTAREVNEV
jgi:hypothetical protein